MIEISVAVRDLAEFVHRSGDIDFRFTPSPTGLEGIEGHAELARRRPDSYQRELALQRSFECGEFSLLVRGRADGYDAGEGYIEEIKTTRVDPANIPPAVTLLHEAQAKLYGGLLCSEQPEIEALYIQVCYFNIDSGCEDIVRQLYKREHLLAELEQTVSVYVEWMRFIQGLRAQRDASISGLVFPHVEYRAGQREMAETVYKCISQQGQLLLQAPTGIGKTAAVVYPAIKALESGKHDLFAFVTAKTVGARAVEETLRLLQEQGLQLRSLTITAKEKVCFSPGSACHGEDCIYARGYYDRLPTARKDALSGSAGLTRTVIENLAEEHRVCPYQLASDLLAWVDACIADIHHFYSFQAGIAARLESWNKNWSILLDEAHNLPERALGMFSASLSKSDLMGARREASGPVRKALDGCNRQMLALNKLDWQEPDYKQFEAAPTQLVMALTQYVGAMTEQQAEAGAAQVGQSRLLEFYFSVLQFLRVLDDWGEDFRFELQRQQADKQSLVVRLQCLDGSRLLAERQQKPLSVTAFSATASPAHWMSNGLGFSVEAVFLPITSPFGESQLSVTLNTRIDTRYRQRDHSLDELTATIGEWLALEQGNCIVYFPSYTYMNQVLERLRPALEQQNLLVQRSGMSEQERADLIDQLRRESGQIAFCILGGVFGEGVDLPGAALSSVVIVGVGLPQFNRDTQNRREYYQSNHGQGFEYTYLYPGMQKVSQALGRVIRGPEDVGRALLIDSRYRDRAYRELLPAWWHYSRES